MKHKKYHLIYFFSLLFFILALTNTTSAQSSYLDSLDGKFALQFQINENFTLTNFQGSTFSGKYHPGTRSALRLGFSISFEDANRDQKTILEDTLKYNQINSSNSVGFGMNLQYLDYLLTTDNIGFYLGTGPSFGFSTFNEEFEYLAADNTVEKGSRSSDNFIVGLDAIAGVEWSFAKNMTLSAEYVIKFYYTHSSENSQTSNKNEEHTFESFRLTGNYINFGISVYF
jgi:opacity protein-like surface antigen